MPNNIIPSTTPSTSGPTAEQKTNDMNSFIGTGQMADAASRFPTDTPVSLVNGQTINDLLNQAQTIQAQTRDLSTLHQFGENIGTSQGFNEDAAFANINKKIATDPTIKFNVQKNSESLGAGDDLERYKQSKHFNTLGYTPGLGEKQEFKYGDVMTWGETMGKAVGGAYELGKATFIEGFKGWGRMVESLVTLDLSKLMGSEQERYDMAKEQQEIFDKYAIYDTKESKDGSLWNRQFFGSMLQQSGFALGAGLQMAVEAWMTGGIADLLEIGLASSLVARTGKTAAEVRELAGVAEKTSAIGKGIERAKGFFSKPTGTIGEALNDARKTADIMTKEKGVAESLAKFTKSLIPFYETGEEIAKLNKAGAGTLQLVGAGLGGIKRGLSEFNMARSESIYEAASTYKQLQDKLVKEYTEKNGEAPDALQLEKIRQSAENASHDNFWTNVGVLSLMNKIEFDNMFKSFNGTRSIFSEGAHALEEHAFDVAGKVDGKMIRKAYTVNPYFGKMGALGDISKTFGGKKAAWEATKIVGGKFLKIEGSEGVQELLQNASDQGLEDYYYDLYHGQKGYGETRLGKVMDGFTDQLHTVEGAKTFIMGALTGALLSPLYKGIRISTEALNDRKQLKEDPNYKTARQKAIESVDLVNAFYSGDKTAHMKEWIANVKIQNKAAESMEDAARNHDKYAFYNAKNTAFNKMVGAAIKLNMFESVRDSIKELGDTLKTDEEFKQAFDMEPTKENRGNAKAFMHKIANDLEEYHATHTKLMDKYADIVIPKLFKNNTVEEQANAKVAYEAVHQAIGMLTFNVQKAKQTVLRNVALKQEMSSNPNIGSSAGMILTKAGGQTNVDDSIKMLNTEIKQMTSGGPLTEEQRTLVSQKVEEVGLLKKWADIHHDVELGEYDEYSPEHLQSKAYSTFTDLINFYNKQNKLSTNVSKQDAESVFISMLDFMKLNRDNRVYVDAVNLLSDPNNMDLIMRATSSAIVATSKIFTKEHNESLNKLIEAGEENKPEEPSAATPSTNLTYNIKEEADGSFTVVDSEGKEITKNLATKDDAQELIDSLNKQTSTTVVNKASSPALEEIRKRKEALNYSANQLTDKLEEKINDLVSKGATKNEAKDIALKEMSSEDLEALKKVLTDLINVLGEEKEELNNISNTLVNERINNPDVVKAIEASNKNEISLEDLDKVQTDWNDSHGLTEVLNDIDAAKEQIKNTESTLKDLTPVVQQYLDEDSDEFKKLYNDGLNTLSRIVNKPDITPDEIKSAFDHFFDNVTIKLDPSLAARNMYKKKHKQEMEALIQKANLNIKANDVKGAKQSVTDTYNSDSSSLNDAADNVFNVLNNGLNPEHKAEVMDHFEQSYLKNIARRISNLINRANGIVSDGIHFFLKQEGEKRVLLAEKLLNSYKEEAIELKKSIDASGIKLNVEHDESYSTGINRNIQNNTNLVNKPVTPGQSVAIDNLLQTGILTEEDLDGKDRNMMVDASSIINIGSARIATIEINKLANEYIKEKSDLTLKNLKTVAKQYLTSIYGSSREALEIINDLVDGEKDENGKRLEGLANFDDVDSLLSEDVLNVPKIKKLVTNEQYALLATFKKNLFQSQAYGNILNVFNTISDKESEAISKSEINSEDFITLDDINSIPNTLFQKDSDNKTIKNTDGLRNDILSLVNTLDTSSKDETEVNKLIKDIASKHFNTGSQLNGRGIIQSYIGAYLNVKSIISTSDVVNDNTSILSQEEMLTALNNSKTTSLSKSQIASVDEFAKTTLLDAYKEKLNAAIGYLPQDLNYSPEKLDTSNNPVGTFSSLRQKYAADIRTKEELLKAINATDNKMSTKDALQFVMDSEFATDAEKELASNLLAAVQDNTFMTLADNSNFETPSAGDFDPNTNEIRINMDAVGHKEGYKSVPLETVILHELIHQLTESALADPNSEFTKGIRSLISAVKNVEGVDTFYAFQKSLSSDEQLREFVAEALTNPAFQYILAKTPYANSKMSVWDKLMDIINKVLSAVGISGDNSALSEVLSLTGDLLNPAEPSHFGFITETMQKVNKAKSLEELNKIKEDLFNNREKVNDDLYSSLKNSIDGKEKSIRQQNIKEELKKYDAIKINNVTYHYQLKDTGLVVFKITRNATKTKIKDQVVTGKIIEKLLSEKGVKKLLSKRAINDIMREAGDPMDRGSYASGEMDRNGPALYETKYPKESEVHINLPFEPGMFTKFTREFWNFKKSGKLDLKLDYLKKEYGATAVMNYSELASKLDRDQINNLVLKKWISTEKKMGGFSLEDHLNEGIDEDRLFQMYHDVLAGINIDDTDYKAIKKQINSVLKTELGVNISNELQTKIENKLFYEDIQVDDDAPINEPVEPGEEPKVVYTKENESDNIVDYKINEATSAKETSALRSFNPDNFGVDNKTGELKLTNQFKNFYYKIRNIINALSIKDITTLKGYHVTMDKDNANLRWDGSAEDENYKKAEKGVIGYISDDKGNPLVFDTKGNMIGTLDKNNLSDHKGLNNGDNQIVYFTLMKNNNEHTNLDSFKDAADLKIAREKVMNGSPQIGRLINVSQGQMNLQGGLTQKNSERKRSNDNDFSEQLNQDHVSITLSDNGRALLINITGPDGAVNREGLYPPNINTLHVNTGDHNISMFDYIIELMQTYRNMAESKDSNLLNVQQNLKDFLGHILYKGNVRIGGEFYNIEVNTGKKDDNGKYIKEGFPVFKKDANGNWVVNNENFYNGDPSKNVFNMLRNYINKQPLNIDKEWLSGKRAFMFPIIKEENGKKIVTFVEKDYRDFLLKEVGFATNIRTIPAQNDIERFNSMVHFDSPKDLSPKTTPIQTTNQNLVDNPGVVKQDVKEDIKNADTTNVTDVKNTRKKKFRAPVQEEVFEKTCK